MNCTESLVGGREECGLLPERAGLGRPSEEAHERDQDDFREKKGERTGERLEKKEGEGTKHFHLASS